MENIFTIGTIEIGNQECEVRCYKKGTQLRAIFHDRKAHDVKLHSNGRSAYIIQNNVKYFIKPRK